MSAREQWEARLETRLKRENSEQLVTIENICEQLGFHDLFSFISVDSSVVNTFQERNKRVTELRVLLADKKTKYDDLQQKITAYVGHAQRFDSELARNEREKAEILEGFQRNDGPNGGDGSTFVLSELEGQLQRQEAEKVRLMEDHDRTRDACMAVRVELKASNDRTKSLHSELRSVKREIAKRERSSYHQQIRENNVTIETLSAQLRKAKQQIQSLLDNKAVLIHAFDDADEVTE